MAARKKIKNNVSHVLVVEDSATQAQELRHILEQNRYLVSVAHNGEEALAQIKKKKPTLIISDILMPGMNGYELCKQVKKNKKLRDIPFILLTSLSDPEDIVRGLDCGTDNFVIKPYDKKYLLARIHHLLTNLELRERDKVRMGVELYFAGKRHFITSDRRQILDLLISTFESAVHQNHELVKTKAELKKLNEELEKKVTERTAELTAEIEEKKKLETQLLQAQKMEALGRLAGGVAHDFNNLLMGIMGYAELAEQFLPEDHRVRRDLQEVQSAARKAADLTRQLLAFSRREIIQPKVVDLNELLLNLEKMLKRLIGEDVELVIFSPPEKPFVKIDPGQMEQILMNLAVNARDAMPLGGKLHIEVQNTSKPDESLSQHLGMMNRNFVEISVKDNGSGMDEETLRHVFEPFFTTKEPGKGTGLGLATVYGIVQQNGGYIKVESKPGEGAEFRLGFPREQDQTMPAPGAIALETLRGGTETILLVEDETLVRDVVSRLLRKQGYAVLEATNGEEALQTVRQEGCEKIHLLISDVVMPKMGGKELHLKLKGISPDMKVLFTSGYTNDAVTRYGVMESEFHFLQKPYQPAVLVRKVREILDVQE